MIRFVIVILKLRAGDNENLSNRSIEDLDERARTFKKRRRRRRKCWKVHTIGHLPARKEYHVDGQAFPGVFPSGLLCPVNVVELTSENPSRRGGKKRKSRSVGKFRSVGAKERKRRRSGRGTYRYIFLFLTPSDRVVARPVFPCVFSRFLIVQTSPILAYFLSGYFLFQHPPRGWKGSTTVPGSTTRTNIELETAIRRPEYGHGSPRTSSRARNACVAFKPAPKPTLSLLSLSLFHPLLLLYTYVRTFRSCVRNFESMRNFYLPRPIFAKKFTKRFTKRFFPRFYRVEILQVRLFVYTRGGGDSNGQFR